MYDSDMKKINNTEKEISKKRIKKSSLLIQKVTLKKLRHILNKLNKGKKMGRNVSIDELILKSLSLLNEDHLNELADSSLSNEDRFKLIFQRHKIDKPKLSEEEFYGMVLRGQINLET
jgi:hypothetical protein